MKRKGIIVFTIILLVNVIGAFAKDRIAPKVYLFGFSASFTDSVVYFTEIQEIDSVMIEEKSDFLQNRKDYSNQLRDYFTGKGEPNRTCITSYAYNRKDIEKKYMEMKDLYKKTNKKKTNDYIVKILTKNEFSFERLSPMIEISDEDMDQQVEDKKKKKSKDK